MWVWGGHRSIHKCILVEFSFQGDSVTLGPLESGYKMKLDVQEILEGWASSEEKRGRAPRQLGEACVMLVWPQLLVSLGCPSKGPQAGCPKQNCVSQSPEAGNPRSRGQQVHLFLTLSLARRWPPHWVLKRSSLHPSVSESQSPLLIIAPVILD